ncbi:hypothetical protein LPB142_13060 [Rhodobacter xanthinilyticus]|uniref:DUF1330 domain-containing protein n=1 Tax=Rhodobacter xanthinilyticus TaxID=1850250 RepID=A0A1D9ME47_9RHOB|nr:DUF1330 domain-containing protein [Rhodobacter xanthinilyticus]AOZ70131.1 hypothetical protein LPB142_13060 [Rhodobacter xanthinilyticus]
MSAPGFWVAHVTILDPAGYAAYRAAAAPAIAAAGGRIRALGAPQDTVAGQMRPDTVIVEFPSLAAARACYFGAPYQATLAARDAAAAVDLTILEGLPFNDAEISRG